MKEGEKRLREMIGKARRREDRTIAGQEIFELHATHGYPPDMTYEIIDDYNKRNESDPNLLVKVDRDGYRKAMAEHKELARTSWKGAELGDEAVILARARFLRWSSLRLGGTLAPSCATRPRATNLPRR